MEVDNNRRPTRLHKNGGLSHEKPACSPFQGVFHMKCVKRIPDGLPSPLLQTPRKRPGQPPGIIGKVIPLLPNQGAMLRAQLFLQQLVLRTEAITDAGNSLILNVFLAPTEA